MLASLVLGSASPADHLLAAPLTNGVGSAHPHGVVITLPVYSPTDLRHIYINMQYGSAKHLLIPPLGANKDSEAKGDPKENEG